ncbi:MAG: PRC-barrel domain-containing protein [Calditrichaceae bacterium]
MYQVIAQETNRIEIALDGELTKDDFMEVIHQLESLCKTFGPINVLLDATHLNKYDFKILIDELSFYQNYKDQLQRVAVVSDRKFELFVAEISKNNIEGTILDMYFDDLFWNIQYIVAETGGFLPEKVIIISHYLLGKPEFNSKTLPLNTSFDTKSDGNNTQFLRPVSENKIINASKILEWPLNQTNLKALNSSEMKNLVTNMGNDEDKITPKTNPHLRSWNEVLGYNIQAKNGEIGHVDDFIVETDNWKIRYMIIDTHNWLPGSKDVLISPAWIEKIKWNNNLVYVDLNKEAIKNSPDYDPDKPIDDEFELKLFKYYGRQYSKK